MIWVHLFMGKCESRSMKLIQFSKCLLSVKHCHGYQRNEDKSNIFELVSISLIIFVSHKYYTSVSVKYFRMQVAMY